MDTTVLFSCYVLVPGLLRKRKDNKSASDESES